jgi:hypothetical protein
VNRSASMSPASVAMIARVMGKPPRMGWAGLR